MSVFLFEHVDDQLHMVVLFPKASHKKNLPQLLFQAME